MAQGTTTDPDSTVQSQWVGDRGVDGQGDSRRDSGEVVFREKEAGEVGDWEIRPVQWC